MADSAAFDCASTALEQETEFDRLESRGTIRILLKQGGLDAKTVGSGDLATAIKLLLAGELESRGVKDPAPVITAVVAALAAVPDSEVADSPENVFARLGGN